MLTGQRHVGTNTVNLTCILLTILLHFSSTGKGVTSGWTSKYGIVALVLHDDCLDMGRQQVS